MKFLFSFLAAALLFTGTSAQRTVTLSDSTLVFNVKVDSSYSGGYSQCNARTVSILEDGKEIHSITLDDNIVSCEWLQHDFFVLEDMNFDGRKDFRLLQSMSPGGNKSYAYWLYDPSTRAFARNMAYEDSLATVEFDQQKKLIRSYWSGGTEYGSETYKIVKGMLVLTERETVMPEESATGFYIRTVYKPVNGVMKKATTERLTEEEFSKRQE